MKTERERSKGKISADAIRLNDGNFTLPADDDECSIIMLVSGSCNFTSPEQTITLNPGCVMLLGTGCSGSFQQIGHTIPEMAGCRFPSSALHELRKMTQRDDFARLFASKQFISMYGAAQWNNRIRTLLELMRSATDEPDFPGLDYLALLLHYVEHEYTAESKSSAHPHNETVEKICAYLASNYQQKFSLSEVAAHFYLSPYYLSRLFRRVTGQSIVDYVNSRRIEAAQHLLETTELSISAVAEQTGFSTAAHFRRVFHELMGIGPLQYRKSHKKL